MKHGMRARDSALRLNLIVFSSAVRGTRSGIHSFTAAESVQSSLLTVSTSTSVFFLRPLGIFSKAYLLSLNNDHTDALKSVVLMNTSRLFRVKIMNPKISSRLSLKAYVFFALLPSY